MVYSSPPKRSALGSISSILNTTPKTPAKHGRVGKTVTPKSTSIKHKIVQIFTGGNKENSPHKQTSPHKHLFGGFSTNAKELSQNRLPGIKELIINEEMGTRMGDVKVMKNVVVASVVDVSVTCTTVVTSQRPLVSPEVREMAKLLSDRLHLAAYKVQTHQTHTPLAELSAMSVESNDAVSTAITRFQESKKSQELADYYRKHRLSTICRRESRKLRTQKSQSPQQTLVTTSRITTTTTTRTTTSIPVVKTMQAPSLTRVPSTIVEVPSDQEEPQLPSPPDSQSSKPPPPIDLPSTPAPKRKIRRLKKNKIYNEHNGHLGLSSPPQQEYDPTEDSQWNIDDVEVADVPSSVLRGVEGLWALGK